MVSAISRRYFLKMTSLAAILGLINPGCWKKKKEQVISNSNTATGDDLIPIKAGPILFGAPVVLCGSHVKGKPNFNVLGNFGIISIEPPNPIVYISSQSNHYTNIGIRENNEFSVCFPIREILARTDYCGVVSGHKVDKSQIFKVQYGILKNAPLIKECNICFACKVTQQLKVGGMEVFFGEIIEKFGNKSCLINGKPDPEKIKSISFGPGNAYREVDVTAGIPLSEYRKYSE